MTLEMLAMRKRCDVAAGSVPGASVVEVDDVVVVDVELVEAIEAAPGAELDVALDASAPRRDEAPGERFAGDVVVGRALLVVDGTVVVVVVVVVVGATAVVGVVGPGGVVVEVVVVGRAGTRTPYAAWWSSSPWRATATDALKLPLPIKRRSSSASKAAHAAGVGGGRVVVVVLVVVAGSATTLDAVASVAGRGAVATAASARSTGPDVVGTGRVGCGAVRSALHAPRSVAAATAATPTRRIPISQRSAGGRPPPHDGGRRRRFTFIPYRRRALMSGGAAPG
jgi:hypothetical protein